MSKYEKEIKETLKINKEINKKISKEKRMKLLTDLLIKRKK
jgi:hypothetical protein